MSRAVISVRTSASPAVNWSDVTWSPCFAACRTASVMASAWAGVNSASVSARATACVSQHAPQLSPKTPPPKGCNCDADDELTGRVPVAADDELSARRERHDAVVRRGVRRGRTARLPRTTVVVGLGRGQRGCPGRC